MTWATTHLAVESLLVFLLLPSEKKKYYSQHRRKWMAISLLAELPDLDTFTRVHRSLSHSFFVAIVVSLLLYVLLSRVKIVQENQSLGTGLTYLPVFWIMHIIFDLGFGPLQLFYPLTDSFYLVTFSLLFSLKPIGPIPFLITGIKIDIKVLTPSAGVKSFISNLSYEERLAIFGTSNISYPIDDFPLHATLFITWVLWGFSPWLHRKLQVAVHSVDLHPIRKIIDTTKSYLRKTPEGIFSAGFFFLMLLLLMTAPLVPVSKDVSIISSWDLRMMSEQATLMQGKEIILPESMDISTTIYFPASLVNITIGYTFIEQFPTLVVESLNDVLEKWNASFATPDFRTYYQASLDNLSSLLPKLTLVKLSNTTQAMTLSLSSVQHFSVLFLLLDWEASGSFVKQGSLQVSGIYEFPEKRQELIKASFFMLISALILGVLHIIRIRKRIAV